MKLRPYQELARDFLRQQPRAGLFLDMGYGKTAITLSALTADHLPALVVAPKRVAEHVWRPERDLWRPDLSLSLAAGVPERRRAALDAGADITVVGRDNLENAVGGPWKTMILDELSGFKARSTNRWKSGRNIRQKARCQYTWGLTGTPSPNGLLDLWAQIWLLDQGERLGKTFTAYRNRFFYPGSPIFVNGRSVVVDWHPKPEAEQRIFELISDICLSMEGEVELPPITYNYVEVPMSPGVRKVYKEFKKELVVDLDLLGGEVHSAANAAVLTGKLSQITAGFLYVDKAELRKGRYDQLHDEKIKALQEIVEGTGSPILVFYRFKPELAALRAKFPQAMGVDDAPDVLDRWNRGEVPILLAHPASAGHGLNLQYGGHTVVWTSPTWDLELWQQANKRLARPGQKNPVVIHVIMMENSVDQLIVSRLDGKTYTQHQLLKHLESPL